MSSIGSRLRWIGERRGNRVGPVDASDLRACRAIGVVLLLVSLAVAVYIGIDFDYAAYTTFRGELRTARGTVTAVGPTDTYEPGVRSARSRRDERSRIVAVRYTFVGPDRVERTGVSYRPDSRLTVGAQVTIEYPAGRPEVSRIRGYRTATFDRPPAALYILAGAGGALVAVATFYPLDRRRAACSDD